MQEYHFNAALAREYGVDGAVFLHAIAFWVEKNAANRRHLHEGRYWTYNTRKALSDLFPFWTKRQLERITNRLREAGALLTGSFSEDKTDRTIWYALSDHVLDVYGLTAPTISPNGEMHFPEPCNPFHRTVKCNKKTVTDQLCNIPPYNPPKGERGKRAPPKELEPEVRAMLNAYVAGDPELAEAMQGLMEIRLAPRSKAVNTPKAIKLLLTELDKLSGGRREEKLQILRQSVSASWIGVFPIRGQPRGQPRRHTEEVDTW